MEEDKSKYPESVSFSGIGYTSLKQVHISAFLIILVGIIIALYAPPGGFFLLIIFLLFVLVVEVWMMRRSQKQISMTLHLREDPVAAYQDKYKIGDIDKGSIEETMDNPNELGYRPAPNRSLITWTFESEEDKNIVAKRLLEYLPRDD
ncbi:MAG: hypothetical protein JRN15_23985 [Nitrososphaerota archaeon]|nr:hypothetical protein [Nitrososphaerota archaeon]